MTNMKFKTGKYRKSGRPFKYVLKVPKGWRKTQGAQTAPNGYDWYNNGQSIFSGKRRSVIVKQK